MSQPSVKITNGVIDAQILATTPTGSENALVVRTIGGGSTTITGSLPAGTNAIGSITNTGFAITSAIPTGSNAIGSITNTGFGTVGAAKGTSTALSGTVKSFDANTNALDVAVNGYVNAVLSTGSNVIGSISNTGFAITSSIPAGTNAIGSITNTGFAITSSIPAGANAIGSITNTSFGISGSLPAGSNTIGAISNTAFTANIGTTNGLALDATMTGGTARVRMTDGTNFAAVKATTPFSTDYGVVVRAITADSMNSSYSNISTATTTAVKASAGSLFRILINGSGDTGATAVLWDGAVGSGTKIATINLASEPTTLNYNVNFVTSLNVVTTTTGAAADITVVYA